MAYTLSFVLPLPAASTGLTDLRAQILDTAGADVGAAISTGFVEIGSGFYAWSGSIPDGHRGNVKFYSNSDPTAILAACAINPEEAEYTDAPISDLGSPAQAGDEMDLVDAPNATAVAAIQSGLAVASLQPDYKPIVDEDGYTQVDLRFVVGRILTDPGVTDPPNPLYVGSWHSIPYVTDAGDVTAVDSEGFALARALTALDNTVWTNEKAGFIDAPISEAGGSIDAQEVWEWANGIEPGVTPKQALQRIAAVIAGKVSGAGSGLETFTGLDGATPRVEVATDPAGNRLEVTYDPS